MTMYRSTKYIYIYIMMSFILSRVSNIMISYRAIRRIHSLWFFPIKQTKKLEFQHFYHLYRRNYQKWLVNPWDSWALKIYIV